MSPVSKLQNSFEKRSKASIAQFESSSQPEPEQIPLVRLTNKMKSDELSKLMPASYEKFKLDLMANSGENMEPKLY